jgi:hypothetical protein
MNYVEIQPLFLSADREFVFVAIGHVYR